MSKTKLVKAFCLTATLIILCLTLLRWMSGGCAEYRGFMSDERILEEAQTFVANMNIDTYHYDISCARGSVEYRPGEWTVVYWPDDPDGFLYCDGTTTWHIPRDYSFDWASGKRTVPQDDPRVKELSDVSFDEYYAFADAVMGVLKTGMTEPGTLTFRYNREYITASDYLYCDFERSFLESEAFIDLMGEQYDKGFIVFIYQGKRGTVNRCMVDLTRYAEDGITDIGGRLYFTNPALY